MESKPISRVIQRLRTDARDGMTDGELLARFLGSGDGDSLTALVWRHGPMVWGVCSRLLRSHHDAEDAFQATFLVLVQKAAALPDREKVGNWLYGVARQTAVRMRAVAARRGGRERQVAVLPEPAAAGQCLWDDLAPVLDEELSRLPDKYRLLVVLCDLEGVTRKEVARRLGIPEGTAASRLAAAREMLARRLARRGVAVSGVLLGAVLSQQAASAGVPALMVSNTSKAATLLAAGHAAAGAISPTVAALMTGVKTAMFLTRIKIGVEVLLAVGLLGGVTGLGVGALGGHTATGPDDRKPTVGNPVGPGAKLEWGKGREVVTAWGKEVNGLQAGLSYRPGGRRAYRYGEKITLFVRVRNVGKKAVTFEYIRQFLDETRPTVTDADGTTVPQARMRMLGFHFPQQVTLEPGKEVELETRMHGASGIPYEFRPTDGRAKPPVNAWPIAVGTGKVRIQYDQVIGNSSSGFLNNPDPNLSKLATGELILDILPAPPAAPAATEKK